MHKILFYSKFFAQDSEEELVIPPPRPKVELDYEQEDFNVEQRLKSLLDGADDNFPPEEFAFENGGLQNDSLRELDKIGYVVRLQNVLRYVSPL